MTRHVAVFTSSRADLGPLGPVIHALDEDPGIQLTVIATGTHSAPSFGGRLGDIRLSGTSVLETVEAEVSGTTPAELSRVSGRITEGVSSVLERCEVDILVLLGDRWELLAAASAALLHGVPIAHLHGGETTEGAIDERIRHSITKLSDLHLCATTDSARRIRHLGEEAWRIIVTGAPGLDRMASVEPLTDDRLSELLGFEVRRPFGVIVYHPPTVSREEIAATARAVFDAGAQALGSAVVLYPGADPGSDTVMTELLSAADRHENLKVIRNLGDHYLPTLASANLLLGNSSSGIIEAASLSLPVVNVGDRQRGRLRPINVIDVGDSAAEIRAALDKALSEDFKSTLVGMANPYGDGRSAQRVVEAIISAPLDRLLHKPFVTPPVDELPIEPMLVAPEATIRETAEAIQRGRAQIALVTDSAGHLVGTVSDGDVRRALLDRADLDSPIGEFVTVVPVVARDSDSSEQVLRLMQQNTVAQVPVVDSDNRLVGLHLMRSAVSRLLDTGLDAVAIDTDVADPR